MWGWGVADGATHAYQNCTINCHAGFYNDQADGEFDAPHGIAIDSDGNIWVTDTFNGNVQKFDPNMNFIARYGTVGQGGGAFRSIDGIVFDSDGNIYIADSYNYARMNKFDHNMNFIKMWGWGVSDGEDQFEICTSNCQTGQSSQGDGGFGCPSLCGPHGVAVDRTGNILVSDTNNGRIEIFDQEGNYLGQFGSVGIGNGQFNQPYGLAFDSSGDLYIVDGGLGSGVSDDTNNNRVEKFTPVSAFTLDPHGSVTASYLNVSHSNNIGSTITCTPGCVDGGGNSGWIFPSSAGSGSNIRPTSFTSAGGSSASILANLQAIYAYNNLPLPEVPGCPEGYSCIPLNTSPTTTTAATFPRSLKQSDTGPDVKSLQQYLNSKGYPVSTTGPGSPGHETSLFGPLTKSALIRFQKDHSIPATGFFGPITRGYVGSH
jgi:hypothetical protein